MDNSFYRVTLIISFWFWLPLNSFAFQASDPPGKALDHRFDIRPVYYYVNTTERDGSEHSASTLNLRARVEIGYQISESLWLRGRVAARLSDQQDSFRFSLRGYTGGNGSYPAGIATLDEFMLRWQIHPDLRMSAGRFQGRFPLEGFIPKGIDRYYAANLSIAHTDGLWLDWNVNDKWRLHLIGSHNSPSGSSHAARSPLRFDEAASARITGFANLQHRDTRGRWAQREFSLSMTPQNFTRDGDLKNHIALSTRWMVRPIIPVSGVEYMIGAELGFIPVAPNPADAGFQIQEDRLMFGQSAVAWQISAYANRIFEHHRIGILYGQTDPHWLISSSFAPNVTMAEFRYRWTITSWVHYEFRIRLRDEIYRPSNADQTKQIFDFYTRFTLSF